MGKLSRKKRRGMQRLHCDKDKAAREKSEKRCDKLWDKYCYILVNQMKEIVKAKFSWKKLTGNG